MRKLLLVFVTLSFSVYGLSQNLPHILLTNDDGIDAPGLLAMYQALSQVGTVTVAAPATTQSLRAWIPAIPGINVEGDYQRDYVADPGSWIAKEHEEVYGEWMDKYLR